MNNFYNKNKVKINKTNKDAKFSNWSLRLIMQRDPFHPGGISLCSLFVKDY